MLKNSLLTENFTRFDEQLHVNICFIEFTIQVCVQAVTTETRAKTKHVGLLLFNLHC